MRKKVVGTPERPRLNIYRGNKNLHVQIIDDFSNKVLVSTSTVDKEFKKNQAHGGNIKAANLLAEIVAKKAKDKGILKIVFDRSGYLFHGRVKSLAEGLRKQGLNF